MKWISLATLIVLLSACNCCRNRTIVEYDQVTYRPAVVTSAAVVTSPVYYDPVTVIDDDPIDVTTTTLDYY